MIGWELKTFETLTYIWRRIYRPWLWWFDTYFSVTLVFMRLWYDVWWEFAEKIEVLEALIRSSFRQNTILLHIYSYSSTKSHMERTLTKSMFPYSSLFTVYSTTWEWTQHINTLYKWQMERETETSTKNWNETENRDNFHRRRMYGTLKLSSSSTTTTTYAWPT